MKGVDLSNYALEDLLSFDDIFLDYFNNFLKNCAFPQVVQYNRYLSIFEEIDSSSYSIVQTDRLPKHVSLPNLSNYNKSQSSINQQQNDTINLNNTEQNKVMDWVRQERLPLFFRTDMFRDFKLCKLLTRSLEEESVNSETSSQLIGGYSRQSPPISATLSTDDQDDNVYDEFLHRSTSNVNYLNESEIGTQKYDDDADDDETDSNLDFVDMPFLEKFNKLLFQRPGSRALSVPSYFPFASMNQYVSSNLLQGSNNNNNITNERNSTKKRVENFKLNQKTNELKSNLKRQENLEKMVNIGEENKMQTSNKNLKSATKGSTKTIGFSFKYTDNSNEYYSELNPFYQSESNDVYGVQNTLADDDIEENYVNEDKKINETLKIADTLSYNFTEYTETYKVHASINQYKMKLLGSMNGMNEFKAFLKDTAGNKLLRFWLDCEFYRDSMQDYDQFENMATRNRLFRDITEKHVFSFAKKVHEKISESYFSNATLTHNLFDRIQYDILRRLRAYWVPRFILNKLKKKGKDFGAYPLPPITPEYSRESTYITAPSTSKTINLSTNNNYIDEVFSQNHKTVLYEKVKKALLADKDAGGPFLRYLSINNPDSLALILFWYDVCDFNETDTIGYDKNSKLQHAWAIYNSYLSSTARFNIGLPSNVAEEARELLQKQAANSMNPSTSSIDTSIFQPIMDKIIPYLQDTWIKFIREDVMKYTKARLSALNTKNENSDDEEDKSFDLFIENMPQPDVAIDENNVYVKRTWLQHLLSRRSQYEKPEKKPIVLTEAERAKRLRRLKRMEEERRRTLAAITKRNKAKKGDYKYDDLPIKKKIVKQPPAEKSKTAKSNDTAQVQPEKPAKSKKGTFQTDRSTFFEKMINTNKSMMQMFRKYFVENGQRDYLNKFAALLDARAYLDLSETHKKHTSGVNLMKTYLEQNSKKSILPLSDKLHNKLTQDIHTDHRDARPRTPFISLLARDLKAQLEEQYQRFCELQANEHDIPTAEQFALMSQTELLVLLGDNYNTKDFDFDEEKGEGKLLPSKEDRAEFIKTLYEWSIGHSAEMFYGFYAHLNEHGRKDGFPFLDKDLLFSIDTIRLKEIDGDEVIKQKAQLMIEYYLDSQIAPVTQIDINHDMHQKLLKSAIRITQLLHGQNDLLIFDEARAHLFKELLPYWSGFKFAISNITDETQMPLTKQQKLLRERLDEFLNAKPPSPNDFKLPPISPRPNSTPTLINRPNQTNSLQNTQHNLNIVFSLATGIRYKDDKHNQSVDKESLLDAGNKKNSLVGKAQVTK